MTISKTLAKQYRDALDRAFPMSDFAQIDDAEVYAVVESVTPYDRHNAIEIQDAFEMLLRYIERTINNINEDC